MGNERNETPVLDFYEMFAEKRGKPMAIPETGAWYNLCDNPRTNGSMCGDRVRCRLTAWPASPASVPLHPCCQTAWPYPVLLRCYEGLCCAACTAPQVCRGCACGGCTTARPDAAVHMHM